MPVTLRAKILRALRNSAVPVPTAELEAAFEQPRGATWKVLLSLERLGVVRRSTRHTPSPARGICVACKRPRKLAARGLCHRCRRDRPDTLTNAPPSNCGHTVTYWTLATD